MLLNEQLYFNINKKVSKEIFLYAKNYILNAIKKARSKNVDFKFLNAFSKDYIFNYLKVNLFIKLLSRIQKELGCGRFLMISG